MTIFDHHPLIWKLINSPILQEHFAEDLHEEASFEIMCRINEIKLFQNVLQDYQIIYLQNSCYEIILMCLWDPKKVRRYVNAKLI